MLTFTSADVVAYDEDYIFVIVCVMVTLLWPLRVAVKRTIRVICNACLKQMIW